ncbi:MAG: acyl-CoA dehydrogenase family protein [Bacteroidia bacterium]|nr:acyl-CoA dehydrogenase family protein [Bacteroidia bacterium]
MKSYYFTEDHELFREALRKFLEKEVIPYIDEWEAQEQVPKSIWKKFGEQGFFGLHYPPKYGGAGLDFFYTVVFCEEIAKVFSGGFGVAPVVTQYMSSPYIYKYGSEALKQKYLVPVIRGEMISAIGISEPGAGSDVANIQTRATRQGDYYIINGQKTFISNGYYGDYVVLVVKTNPEAGIQGISLIVVDLDTPGITKNKLKKLGWHASDTAELFFENVKVPAENLIGEEGQGFFYLMEGLQLERLVGAIGAIAGAEHLIQYTLEYMAQRQAFGRPINKFQVLRHRMAQLHAECEVLKEYVYYCSRLQNDGKYAVRECSIAKLLTTEFANKAAYECLQMFGGYGYIEDYKVARVYRDVRILTIGAGTSEIMREIIAKMLIDDKVYEPPKVPSSVQGNGASPLIDEVVAQIKARAAKGSLGGRLKFDFGSRKLLLDGTGETTIVKEEDAEAPCIIYISPEDMKALLSGELNPMSAFMAGKIKVQGDMSMAMKLQNLLA